MKYTPYKALFGNISTTPRKRKKYFKSYMIKPSFYKKPKIPKKQWETIEEISNPKFKRYIKRTRNYKAMYQDWDKDKVINKYDCEPTNRWKQGRVMKEKVAYDIASKELADVNHQLYILSQNRNRLPEGFPDREILDDEIKALQHKARSLLQTAIRLKVNLDNKKEAKTANAEDILSMHAQSNKMNLGKELHTKKGIKNIFKTFSNYKIQRNREKNYNKFINYVKEYKEKGFSSQMAIYKAKMKLEKDLENEPKSTLKPRDWSKVKLKGGRIKLL